jgi:acetyl esterase/lipase
MAIDHRLAPEHKLKTIVSDGQASYSWLIKEGPTLSNINPKRVAVVGYLAGSYLTLLTEFRVEPRPMALIAFSGYSDLTGDGQRYTKNHSEVSRMKPHNSADCYRLLLWFHSSGSIN